MDVCRIDIILMAHFLKLIPFFHQQLIVDVIDPKGQQVIIHKYSGELIQLIHITGCHSELRHTGKISGNNLPTVFHAFV